MSAKLIFQGEEYEAYPKDIWSIIHEYLTPNRKKFDAVVQEMHDIQDKNGFTLKQFTLQEQRAIRDYFNLQRDHLEDEIASARWLQTTVTIPKCVRPLKPFPTVLPFLACQDSRIKAKELLQRLTELGELEFQARVDEFFDEEQSADESDDEY